MCRRAGEGWIAGVGACVLALGASWCAGQDGAVTNGAEAVETYLSDRGLNELLALHLEQQLDDASGARRIEIAERLGTLYAMLLEQAQTVEERRIWEDRSRTLLDSVPGAETYELRLNLAKVRYLAVEGLVEDARLGIGESSDRDEAERVLTDVQQVFDTMGRELHRRVEHLENQASRGRAEDWRLLEQALTDARRLRSLAMYYAGWSDYYLAFLKKNPSMAASGLAHFGWLLNAESGQAPDLERLPGNTLRYEHVARAAIGTALCLSLRGEDDAAMKWLDAVDTTADAPAKVKAQLFARRLVVLSAANRWADMERLVSLHKQDQSFCPDGMMSVGEARLLAVLSLEAMESGSLNRSALPLVRSLAETGLADLVNLGEVGHVLSLVKRYGTAPIGDQGFIVLYVRGLQAYDQARTLHQKVDGANDEPSKADNVANRYADAANALLSAISSEDADRFPDERANAGLIAGYALYYADRPIDAADLLEATYRAAPEAAPSEDALWLAIVALEQRVDEGDLTQKDRLGALATLYIEQYPQQERAARLLLLDSVTGLVDDERAVELLMGVDPDAPVYASARRQAARILYRMYRSAPTADRDFAAMRFIEVGEEVIGLEQKVVAESADDEEAIAAGQRVLALSRQLLDAMLGMSVPDVGRTEPIFKALESVMAKLDMDATELAPEIAFRRLQVSLTRGYDDEVEKWLAELHGYAGRYAAAADRLLYRKAYDEWTRAPHDADKAAEVVRHGLSLMQQFDTTPEALEDPVVYGLHDTVASAAASAWRLEQDARMRDVALEIDERLIRAGRRAPGVLTRFAELAESTGRMSDALDSWRTLMNGYEAGSEDWFEARYQSLRLLSKIDPARARLTMDQHVVLYPDYGPAPWGEELKALDAQIPAAPETPAEPGRGESGGT